MNRFKELREERGYSIRGLEIKTHINHNSINRYENETRDPSTDTLRQLSTFFEVSIDYLLCHSACYVYAKYETNPFTFKIRDDYYKELRDGGYIYFNNDDKRCINLNKLIEANEGVDILLLIIELARIKKADTLFDKGHATEEEIDELKKEIIDIELNKEFVEMIKGAVRF